MCPKPYRQNRQNSSVNRNDVEQILKEHPELNSFGVGLYDNEKNPSELQRGREYLLNQRGLEEIKRAMDYLTLCGYRKSINYNSSSYGLKHRVERYYRDSNCCGNNYVSNGAFIVAALLCGFKIKSKEWSGPNVFLNISNRKPEPLNQWHLHHNI